MRRCGPSFAPTDDEPTLPSRIHAIVLISSWHKATQRALMFAKATRPDTLTALTVNVDIAETRALVHEWEELNVDVPLKVIESPYREITRPVVDYIKKQRKSGPRDVVNVYIPEYVVGRWWENVLHNQSSLRLKGRLLFESGRHGHQRPLAATLVGAPRPRPCRTRRGRNPQRH